jgi:protein-disulfide isomerase
VIEASPIPRQWHVFRALVLVVAGLALAACNKKSAANPDDAKAVVDGLDSLDRGRAGASPATSGDGAPAAIAGVDLSRLDARKRGRYERLIDSLPSPCGAGHSLRVSARPESACKRAPFAARYVVVMLEDEGTDDDVRELYEQRYKDRAPKTFALEGRPHLGPADARVVLVEFFDYGCPACRQFAPVLKEAVADYPDGAVLYFKQFPLAAHKDSRGAAQAALAAAKQGKYLEMHELLFANQHKHKESDLRRYAESLGLDMKRFDADYQAAGATVDADYREGDAAGVHGTPTLFINGVQWQGPMLARYIKLWIDEELAVNR